MIKKILHLAWWLGLSVYFGGLLTLGAIAAPAIFETTKNVGVTMAGVAAPPLVMSTQVGGEIFGAILNRFAWVELGALGLMLLGLVGMILLHRPARRSAWVLFALWIVLTGLAGYDDTALRPRVWAVRSEVRASAAGQAAAMALDSQQAEFDRLHAESELIGRSMIYLLLGMLVVSSWRGIAEKPLRSGAAGVKV